jgi:hypothetical protein
VNVATGIYHQTMKGGVEHAFTKFLSNLGSIKTVLNGKDGAAVNIVSQGPSFADPYRL